MNLREYLESWDEPLNEFNLGDYMDSWDRDVAAQMEREAITKLKKYPRIVNYDIDIQDYGIKNLEGCPEVLNGNLEIFGCDDLVSLSGSPKVINGEFSVASCDKLTSLQGCPKNVYGDMSIFNTKIDISKFVNILPKGIKRLIVEGADHVSNMGLIYNWSLKNPKTAIMLKEPGVVIKEGWEKHAGSKTDLYNVARETPSEKNGWKKVLSINKIDSKENENDIERRQQNAHIREVKKRLDSFVSLFNQGELKEWIWREMPSLIQELKNANSPYYSKYKKIFDFWKSKKEAK